MSARYASATSTCAATATRGPRRDERGIVGGADGLAIGVLVLLGGTVLFTNLWSVLTTRAALDDGAREYLRAWTAAPSAVAAPAAAADALHRSLLDDGLVGGEIVEAPDPSRFGPCEPATVVVAATVPAVRAPFLGTLATIRVDVRHSELVQPHREVIAGERHDPTDTPCAG
jgi:hypothetical protein